MSFLDSRVVERVKPTLASITNMIFGIDSKSKVNPNSSVEINVFDKFSKKKVEDTIFTPVSKKVWVNGKEYALMGQSQQDLDEKLKKINQNKIEDTTDFVNTDKIIFTSLYTQHQTLKKNNVWVSEYCPN
ncbi:MAG: hypothetical protein H7263_19050 [Candidatus Sericytochromatia bacterium]|nr:hypothetical protein [Candidatus Sericytochromatia bacterium]